MHWRWTQSLKILTQSMITKTQWGWKSVKTHCGNQELGWTNAAGKIPSLAPTLPRHHSSLMRSKTITVSPGLSVRSPSAWAGNSNITVAMSCDASGVLGVARTWGCSKKKIRSTTSNFVVTKVQSALLKAKETNQFEHQLPFGRKPSETLQRDVRCDLSATRHPPARWRRSAHLLRTPGRHRARQGRQTWLLQAKNNTIISQH